MEEREQLVHIFGSVLCDTIVMHGNTLHQKYGISQAARTFIKNTFVQDIIGAQRRFVETVLQQSSGVTREEMSSLLMELNKGLAKIDTPEKEALVSKKLLGSAYIKPKLRELGVRNIKTTDGRTIVKVANAVETELDLLIQRMFLWTTAWADTQESFLTIFNAAVARNEQDDPRVRDILEGMMVAVEPVTVAYLQSVAARGGDLLGGKDDVLPLYVLHYVDGAKTTDMGGSADDRDSFDFCYTVLLNLDPRRRFKHNLMMVTSIARHEDVAEFGLTRLIGGGASAAQRLADTTSWVHQTQKFARPGGVKLDVPADALATERRAFVSRSFTLVDLVHVADTPQAGAGAGMKKAYGLFTKSVCRHCDASQGQDPSTEYTQPADFTCQVCNRLWCRCAAGAITAPFTLRSRGQWEAQRRMSQSLPTEKARDDYNTSKGIVTFEHAYSEVPHSRNHHPGMRFPQMKMHIVDEGPGSRLGVGMLWCMMEDGVATFEQIDRVTREYTGYSPYRGERSIDLRESIKEGTYIEIDGKRIHVPSKDTCKLHGKAAQIGHWILHSIRMYAPLVIPFYEKRGQPLPAWWLQWTQFVEIVALMRPFGGTSEAWGAMLTKKIAEHAALVNTIPALKYLVTKKGHMISHVPWQGVAWGDPDAVTEYPLEGEHQPHKAAARNDNRINTLVGMANSWALDSAIAHFSGELERTDAKRLRRPLFSEELTPLELAQKGWERMLDVISRAGHQLDAHNSVLVHTHRVVQYLGKPIYCGGWVIFKYASQTLSLLDRLAQVDAIFEVERDSECTWVISLNLFPETSLVQLRSGQFASMDPRVRSEPTSTAPSQVTLRMLRSELTHLRPVMKCYMNTMRAELVYFLPE